MSRIQMRSKTAKDVLVEYQSKYGFTDADLMDLFGVSRQMVWNYLRGNYVPSADRLINIAFVKADEWEGQMAMDILKARGINFDLKAVKA